jgi:DNA-binding GntR family transcriptional regulator
MDLSALPTIHNVLLGYLRGKIISGELPGGHRINEDAFAAKLKMSRGPLREAFRILEQERLVVNTPRKGTFVTELSEEDLDEIYEARRTLELAALDLLEEKGITDLPSVAKALQEADTLRIPSGNDRDDFLVFREKITDFHAHMVMAANNTRLSHFYQTLYFSLARYQYLHIALNVPEGFERPTDIHQKILSLINAGQHKVAKMILLDHLQQAHKMQAEALRKHLAPRSSMETSSLGA